MVEKRPLLDFVTHLVLIIGILIVGGPIWLALVASTHEAADMFSGRVPLWFGDQFMENYSMILGEGLKTAGAPPVGMMMVNSLIMALSIAIGKIAISLISAFAIVYFRFPFRMTAFWIIFLTLMLPVEVRILPTFEVVAQLGLLNSYAGLSIPLIASATATFLFRQFFLTVPDELLEAARIDGAGPMRFFWDVLVPLSRTNVAALFVILFIFGWNQYLWPLLVTTEESYYTVVMGIQRMVAVPDSEPLWHLIMGTALLAMLPPVVVVVAMQRLFVRGLVETEK
ncbi:MAG: sn-glycerol-3-phosphate ABC transporter permease UgpE [Alphaproteobacteria bacterium]|nr:sn-glycerol-3-phosphate ABC transporter permease UgpE [Alphaproteobacteria bacterium]